jgi:ribulose-5-phosphate 4-epimerase/fuculose-1-phosphate aldolase
MDEPRGGAAAWMPASMPGVGRSLSDEQVLALALRHLDDLGFCENLSGHITWQREGTDTMLVNPWGLWWGETKASDILEIDATGKVLRGKWDVTPAFHLHTELHKARPDARVVIHNHPIYCSVLAAIGVLPEIVHQNSAIIMDEMVMVHEYDGELNTPTVAAELVRHIGDASVAVLASHGVVVTAPTMEEGLYKAAQFERACEIYWKVLQTGQKPLPIPAEPMKGIKASQVERASYAYFDGAVRPIIANEPDVLN